MWSKTRCAEPNMPRWGQFAPGRAGLKSGLSPPRCTMSTGRGRCTAGTWAAQGAWVRWKTRCAESDRPRWGPGGVAGLNPAVSFPDT